jgi:hypothetical protein
MCGFAYIYLAKGNRILHTFSQIFLISQVLYGFNNISFHANLTI